MNKNDFVKEYHKHLEFRFKRKNPNSDKHSKAFARIYTNSPPKSNSMENDYKNLIFNYLSDLLKFLPLDIVQKIDNDILFDVIANYDFNAACFKVKDERFVAVVFNSNLFELLSKWAKYQLAVNFPLSVYYENGENNPSHNSEYYRTRII